MAIEDDAVRILSGVRHGYTLGTPLALLIENKDFDTWRPIMQPGLVRLVALSPH